MQMLFYRVNDIVLRVNSKPMFNMEHAKAVKELKNAGQRVELVIFILNKCLSQLLGFLQLHFSSPVLGSGACLFLSHARKVPNLK